MHLKKSVFLFHAAAHNPTGVDPTLDQWKKISEICHQKEHIVFFDSAYQGFASGDSEKDAAAFRYFTEHGHHILVAQSYSKNFGLYGERVGALNVVAGSKQSAIAVHSQLQVVIRANFSNPPIFGARLVSTIFNDEVLKTQWEHEVKSMADRIKGMRSTLVEELKKKWFK